MFIRAVSRGSVFLAERSKQGLVRLNILSAPHGGCSRTEQRRSQLPCRARRVLKTSVLAAGALGSAISCRRENGAAWAPGTSRTWKTSRERRAVPRSISIVPISSRRRRRARVVSRRPAWRNRTDRRIGAAVELLVVERRRSRNTWSRWICRSMCRSRQTNCGPSKFCSART
jgi:hypothetical protein